MTDDPDDPDEPGVPFVVPEVSEGTTEAMISSWLVRSGDRVTRDQVIVTLGLDKVDVELESPADGVIVLDRPVDHIAKVGEVIARILPALPTDRARDARHDELYAAIVASPDDLGARQVYADFLLETNGEIHAWGTSTVAMRGEYLSLVLRDGVEPAIDPARRRELGLVAHSTALSLFPLDNAQVIDGFVDGYRADVATLIAHHATAFAHAPIRRLEVSGLATGDGARILALPRLEQLRSLALVGDGTRLDDLAPLIASPRLAGLARLALRALPLGPGLARGIASFDRLEITNTERWSADDLRAAITCARSELVLAGRTTCTFEARVSRLELAIAEPDPTLIDVVADAQHLEHLALRCRFVDDVLLLAIVDALPASVGTLALRGARVGASSVETMQDLVDELRRRTTATVLP